MGTAPITARQLRALIGGAGRELTWGLPAVAKEVRRWRERAAAIPDAPIRQDALDALRRKRAQTDGAALFSIIPQRRSPTLLRVLVAYQILWDFLDSAGERAPDLCNGKQLSLALVDALDPSRPPANYYRHHPWRDDGGYLRGLVVCCQRGCAALPSFPLVRQLVLREARRADVLALNHDPDVSHTAARLQRWASREFPMACAARWFELTAAASAGLTIFALLALAAEARCSQRLVHRVARAYFPWHGALATMLDSYVDQDEDRHNGDHVYLDYYRSPQLAVTGIRHLIVRSLASVARLPRAHTHNLIICCMIAMYLSKDSARAPAMRRHTSRIADAGGALTGLLLPILRSWRTAYHLRSA